MKLRFLFVLGTFVLALLLPWAWFNIATPPPKTAWWITTKGELPGYRFSPDVLSKEVMGLLATTNLVNGSFANTNRSRRVTVFEADWLPTQGVGKTVVNHTPDVCWVGVGWKPIDVGQPAQVSLKLGEVEMPFECRVFEAPYSGSREIILWCTLVNGEVLPETFKFESGGRSGGKIASMMNLSRLAVSRYWERIKRRTPANGHKQFVRYSTAYSGDLKTSLAELQRFGTDWLMVSDLKSTAH